MLVQLTIIRNMLDEAKNDLSWELSKLRWHSSSEASENWGEQNQMDCYAYLELHPPGMV